MAGSLGVGLLATTLLSPLSNLTEVFENYASGLERCEPAGAVVNDQRAVFTFVHCTETREQAIASRAAESALWFVNAAPAVFRVPRSIWIDMIRGQLRSGDPANSRALEPGVSHVDEDDPDDPVPVIRLLNRQLHGLPMDPEEVYEALDALDSVVIGDVETCRRKLRSFADLDVDRLMAFMQFGSLTHEEVMRSLRITGEALLPSLASLETKSPDA